MEKQRFGLKLSLGIAVLLSFLDLHVAMSAELIWKTLPFVHVSENQPIDEFVKELFVGQEPVLSISDEVKGQTVSGRFDESPQKVFSQIANAFDLISYYDGNIFYVLRSSEISSKIVSLKHISTARFEEILGKLNVLDPGFPIRFYDLEGLVHVFGPAPYIGLIEETAKLMDTPDKAREFPENLAAAQTIRVFRLKHAWAEDQDLNVNGRRVRIQGVVAILRDLIQGRSGSAPEPAPEADERTKSNIPVDKLVKVNLNNEQPYPLPDMENLLPKLNSKPPIVNKDSNSTVQAAERINAVVIKDSYLKMPFYQMLIDQLDIPLNLVEIKATIIDVSSDAIKNLGVNWHGGIRDGDVRIFSSSNNSKKTRGQGFNLISNAVGGFSLGTIIGDLAGDYFLARINAMEGEGQAKIVSRPSIITFDNIEAQFKNTDTFFVRVAGERDVGLYEVSTGIVLKVTPHVIEEKGRTKVQLIVNIEDGAVTEKSVDNIPVLKNSNINTQAVVDENDSLLVGGLIYDQEQSIDNKVPVLGDIPFLGVMFRSKQNTKKKMERLFLISPRIVHSANDSGKEKKTMPRDDLPDTYVRTENENHQRPSDIVNDQLDIFTLNI